jgi:FlaG/FlaF family flagellin (archaellin)
MRSLKTLLTVIGAVTVLVLAGNTVALAATGHSFILGQTNKANKITTLKRTTAGSALQVKTTSSSAAPLVVNGKGKVANLNADSVDGYDSSALRTSTYSWVHAVSAVSSSNQILSLAPGSYLVGYDAYMPSAGTAGGDAGCYFYRVRSGNNTYYAETRQTTTAGETVSVSGNGLLSVAAGDVIHWYCYAPAAFTTIPEEPLHAFATRTTVVGNTTLRIAPGARKIH